jgi:hypothetical protein
LSSAEVSAMAETRAVAVVDRAARRAAARAAGVSGVVSSTSREEAAAAARVALLPHWDCIAAGCPVLGARASRGVVWLSREERVRRAREGGARARSCVLGWEVGGPEWRAARAARVSIRGETGAGMTGRADGVAAAERVALEDALVSNLATLGPDPVTGEACRRRALLIGRAVLRVTRRDASAAAAELERLRRAGVTGPKVAAAVRSLDAIRERGRRLRVVVVRAAMGESLPESCARVGWPWDWERGECQALTAAMRRARLRDTLRAELRMDARRVEGWSVALGVGPGDAARLAPPPFGGPDGDIA